MEDSKQKIYKKAKEERSRQTKEVLTSSAKKKIIVAGPGTGKTYLFQQLLEGRPNNCLTLTFINALVDELSLSLLGLSEVRTLHGYALNTLQERGYRLFPKLSNVIEEDAKILSGKFIDFKPLFQKKPLDKELVKFYKRRKDYYGKYYGFSDIIYDLVEYFKDPKNRGKVPIYEQIVVDEFQDFNEFEVELIELLAEQNPILITGDDDQCLYTDFKKAKPDFLRKKHGKEEPDYMPFPLSYCSRSTEVIVGAINDFISMAIKKGLLRGRVGKLYNYFPCKKMDEECEKHPKIIFRPVYSKFFSDFFQEEILNIATKEKKPFEVLIIVPNVLKNIRFQQIIKSLTAAGFRNVNFSKKTDKNPNIIDALALLSKDFNSNLGWRIVAKIFLSQGEFKKILEKTETDNTKNIQELVPEECVSRIENILNSFQKVIKNDDIKKSDLMELLTVMDYNFRQIIEEKVREDFYSTIPTSYSMRAIKNIKINITTLIGSKGLSSDYVFLTDFSDKYFYGKQLTDQSIHEFIVAMTRARKKIYLLSPDDKEATFLNWIKSSRIDKQKPYLRKKWKIG